MIKYSFENGTGIITLNNPEKRNALSPELVSAFSKKLKEIENDEALKALIITGGGTAFCAGADLEYLRRLSSNSSVENEKDSETLARFFMQVYNFPKPVIAAVNGPAIAGGCGLATVCDFIAADKEEAKFGYTEVKIGFIPAVVAIFLIKKIGVGKAKRLLMTGEIINAGEAYNLGLADWLAENPLEKAKEVADGISRNSSFSTELTKSFIKDISNLNVEEAVNYCIRLNAISRSSEDFKKGVSQFLDKK